MTTETSRESANGSGPEAAARAAAGAASASSSIARMAGRLIGAVAQEAQRRVPSADLDERDPDYIRETLPGLWMLASLYFRADVRGLQNIPEEGPVLLVGNHSGGNLTPDTHVFTLAFSTYFGVERRFHQLAHNLVLSMPGLGMLRKYGTVAATPENAEQALDSGAALLVYPGGDYEVHRPTWESARVDFGGRRGFIRLAKSKGVPLVPVVAIGGQETALFLSRGEGIARLLGIDRMFRLKVLPISLALPWGLNVGDMLGHIPLPAKITIQVLEPIDVSDMDVDEAYELVIDQMQTRAHRARRRTQPARPRLMRVERDIQIGASREEIWELVSDPDNYSHFWHGLTRLDRKNDERGCGARFAMRMRVGSADIGGLIEIVEFDEPADMAWNSITGIDHRVRWRLREADDGRTKVTLRMSWDSPGGLLGMAADRIGAPMVARILERTLQNLAVELGDKEVREQVSDDEKMSVPAKALHELGSVKVLIEAGVIRPMRPDRLWGVLRTLQRWGRSPAAGSDLARGALPGRDDDRRRARNAHLQRGRHAHERARPRSVRRRHRRGRRGGDHVPQPPRLHRGDDRGVEARCRCPLPEHRVRGSAAHGGRAAREAEGAGLRRGVLRAARGRGTPPQALRRLARLAQLPGPDARRSDVRGRSE